MRIARRIRRRVPYHQSLKFVKAATVGSFLDDSHAFGSGLTDDQTFAAQLERRLASTTNAWRLLGLNPSCRRSVGGDGILYVCTATVCRWRTLGHISHSRQPDRQPASWHNSVPGSVWFALDPEHWRTWEREEEQ